MKNSDSDGETKRKRAVFNEEDTCLLTRCCQEHESVLNLNITTGGKKTAKLKAKVWKEILASYNSSQTGGMKTLAQLQKKYNNTKSINKLKSGDTSGLSKCGQTNSIVFIENFEDDPSGQSNQIESENSDRIPSPPTVKYERKRVRLSAVQRDRKRTHYDSTSDSNEKESTSLEVEKQKLTILKMKLDIEEKKLDIKYKKLLIEEKRLGILYL